MTNVFFFVKLELTINYEVIMSELKIQDIIEQQLSIQKEAADSALSEYLENLAEFDTKKHMLLVQELEKDDEYKERFTRCVIEMSLLISFAMALKQDEEFAKAKKNVLFNARKDDAFIQEMRMFYSTTITADQLQRLLTTKEEQDDYTKRMNDFIGSYKESRQIS